MSNKTVCSKRLTSNVDKSIFVLIYCSCIVIAPRRICNEKYLVTYFGNLSLINISLAVYEFTLCDKRAILNILVVNKIKATTTNLSGFYYIVISHIISILSYSFINLSNRLPYLSLCVSLSEDTPDTGHTEGV